MQERGNPMLEINQIHLGNSYELIKEIPDKSVDLIIIDPPYNFHCGARETGLFKNRKTKIHDKIQGTILTEGINNDIFPDLIRIMKNINIYIFCNKDQIRDYLNIFYEFKKTHFELLTWHKTNPPPMTKNTFLPDTEYCLYFRKKVLLNDGYDLKMKYWITPSNIDDKVFYDHPTIKPLGIIMTMIKHSSNENDLVLDCFSGSGTTCVAAKELGRRFIGIENDPHYHKISVDRLNGICANGQTSIFTDFIRDLK